jgi:TetR/AcrR family transcriptional regulator, transcriptional repressor for nem operon
MRDRILDAAELRVRAAGYHGFSFRDLASDVGIRSASIHYWFPTKSDLCEVLAHRYTERARERLGDPAALTGSQALTRLVALFREAAILPDRMCLCGMFAAERDAVPTGVEAATAAFFRTVLDYLDQAFGPAWQGPSPPAVLARLEGALILARALRSADLFDQSVAGLPITVLPIAGLDRTVTIP